MLAQCKEMAKKKVGAEIVLTTHYAVYSTNTIEPKVVKVGIKTLEEAELLLQGLPSERLAVIVKVETKIRTIRKVME